MHLLFVLERVLSLHDDTIKIPPPPDERYKRIDESFPRYDILVTGKRSFTALQHYTIIYDNKNMQMYYKVV